MGFVLYLLDKRFQEKFGVVAAPVAKRRLAPLKVSHTDISQVAVDPAREHKVLCRLVVHKFLLDTPPQPRTKITPTAAVTPVLHLVGP